MLRDLYTSLTTEIAAHLRALGFLDEFLNMRRRARTNLRAWQLHLDTTRRFVLSAADRCNRHGTVLVLGSGLLLDLPLAELADAFGRVILQDVVCLPETRKTISRYSNVLFVEQDVTGLAAVLHRDREQAHRGLPDVPTPSPWPEADLVISLNILSQLWVVPRAFVGQNLKCVEPEQADEWCAQIVERHYQWLRSLSCDVCLVADHEAITRDPSRTVISRSSTVFGLELPGPEEHWTWDIAPLGKANPHASKELVVGAFYFKQAP